jgi:hypothetical protein
LWVTGPDVSIGIGSSISAHNVNGVLTLSYEGADIAVLVGHTAQEYSPDWFVE